MTMQQLETWLAVAVSWVGNPLSMWLAINRRPFGWWIVAVTQALFVTFAIIGNHWEFGGQVLCLGMGVYGVWKWQIRHEHEPAIGAAIPAQRGPDDDAWSAAGKAYEQWRIRSEGKGGRAGGSLLPPWPVLREKHPKRAEQWRAVAVAVLEETEVAR
jgi:hypothetical protein